jgi:hypothetical protein
MQIAVTLDAPRSFTNVLQRGQGDGQDDRHDSYGDHQFDDRHAISPHDCTLVWVPSDLPDSLESWSLMMTKQAKCNHAGCPFRAVAETSDMNALDRRRFAVEVLPLGRSPLRIVEVEWSGVKSVVPLLLDGQVLHLNHGAGISALNEPHRRALATRRCSMVAQDA